MPTFILGLESDALALHPNDKHLVRLAEQIGISVFDQFIIHLGLTREEWENIEYQYIRNGPLGVQLMALYEYKRKKQKILQTLCLQDLLDALTEIGRPHSLCQVILPKLIKFSHEHDELVKKSISVSL